MGSGHRVIHSTAGAIAAERIFIDPSAREHFIARILGFIIAGHHSGLPDGDSTENSCLNTRLKSDCIDFSACPLDILEKPTLKINDLTDIFGNRSNQKETAFGLAFFIRMLFSCLVDADRLNSEDFCTPEKTALRRKYPTLDELNRRLVSHLETLSRIDS